MLIASTGFILNFIFSKRKSKEQYPEVENQDFLNKYVTKSGDNFLIKLGDETIKVSSEELYKRD
ncbi:hypothetical protein D3C76_1740650 [compost metagenome]